MIEHQIEHLSWSSMNSFETDIHSFYERYVLNQTPAFPDNVVKAMEFGKNYELMLWENQYKGWDTQKECEFIIDWYKAYGLFDFYHSQNEDIVEVKTKSKWRTEKEIKESRQFRIYNYWCNRNDFRFMIHQFNKKENEARVETINRDDGTFEEDFVKKAQQIEKFLNQFNVWIKKYVIQESK